MEMTTLEKWIVIQVHARAILDYANAQTRAGKKPSDSHSRVDYRAKRIQAIANDIADMDAVS